MKAWLNELQKALARKFYDDEVKDIVSFYEELINDRLSDGESIDQILMSYDIQKIVKDMTPEVLMKRENKSYLQVSKSTKQLLILLLGSPLLIPLAVVYISFLIFVFSMILTAGILLVTGVIGFVTYVVDLFQSGLTLPNVIGTLGFGLMMFGLVVLVALWLYQLMILVWKKTIVLFSKIVHKRGEHQ
ncbi:MAG: DUF1700 domain-containing protein [Acholeplasmataceae bacterium]|jgi:uncharacterized membrane protein|nr:DUF1700 domain-containing protein [Acholeplasmataceae bacterium]